MTEDFREGIQAALEAFPEGAFGWADEVIKRMEDSEQRVVFESTFWDCMQASEDRQVKAEVTNWRTLARIWSP